MAVLLTVKHVDKLSRRGKAVTCEPTFSSTYAPGGQVLDFTALVNTAKKPGGHVSAVPGSVRIFNSPLGYRTILVPGVALTDWKLMFFDEGTGAELAAGAYPAGITDGDANMEVEIIAKF